MILITTSRRPSKRTRTLIRDFLHVIPGAVRVNRGKKSLQDLRQDAVKFGLDRVLIVGERKGNPGLLRFYKATVATIEPIGAQVILAGVTLRRELFGRKPKRVPHVRELAVAYQQDDLEKFAEVLAEGLGADAPSAASEVGEFPDADIVLWVLSHEGRTMASFYLCAPLRVMEMGPRLFLASLVRIQG